MNKLLTFLLLTVLFFCGCASYSTNTKESITIAIFDVDRPQPMPKHFRTTNDLGGFKDEGLIHLHMSGSAQFTAANLPNLLAKIPLRNIIIVDLREESHGFINGTPVSWTGTNKTFPNQGKSVAEIENDEKNRLSEAQQKGFQKVYGHHIPKNMTVFKTSTEKELVRSFGAGYFRIPVTDQHKPSPEDVDQFVSFVQTLPPNTWLHFHCKMGQGRTTTFMILYDIMKNGAKIPLDEIINRQHKLGGSNIFELHDPEKPKHQWAADRLELIKQFYEYRKEIPDFSTPFSGYLKGTQIYSK